MTPLISGSRGDPAAALHFGAPRTLCRTPRKSSSQSMCPWQTKIAKENVLVMNLFFLMMLKNNTL